MVIYIFCVSLVYTDIVNNNYTRAGAFEAERKSTREH